LLQLNWEVKIKNSYCEANKLNLYLKLICTGSLDSLPSFNNTQKLIFKKLKYTNSKN
jgi:hypothetical protein